MVRALSQPRFPATLPIGGLALLAIAFHFVFSASLLAQATGPLRPRRPPGAERPAPGGLARPSERSAVKPDWQFTGMLISMLPNSVEIEMVGGSRVVCALDESTAYATAPNAFLPGDRIAVDSPTGPDAGCRAEWVGRPEQRFSGDPGSIRPGSRIAGDIVPEPPKHDDPLIQRAMEANREFGLRQPDFICRQTVTRSTSRNLGKKWKEIDVLGADVIILDNDERHRNITRNGRPTGASHMSQVGGTWSTGEYSGILWNLFAPESEAEFTSDGEDVIRDAKAAVYRYRIDPEHSRWNITIGGSKHVPGHHGRVWIDLETARALRVEMEADGFPWNHPLTKAETAIDFATVRIREREYLLPIESLALACFSGSARCDKNRIEFTDYRKFETESSVFHTNSEVDYGDESDPSAGQP